MGPEADRSAADALRSWAVANGTDEDAADEEVSARQKLRKKAEKYARQQKALSGFEVRKSLEPAFTQLALNGAEGPSPTSGSAAPWPAPWTARTSPRPS